MKKEIKILVSAVLVAPVLVFASASAIEPRSGSSDSSGTSTTTKPLAQSTTQTESSTSGHSLTPEQHAELQKRLEERKASLKTRLTTLEQTRLKTRCKNSQGALSSLSGRIKGIETSRNEVYGALVDRLSKLQSRLQEHGVDTTKLQTEIVELNVKIATFKTDLTAYKDAVNDLAVMDCQADPTAFKASLETSRAALTKLKQDSADIKTYVNDTIKPTLKEIRAQVEAAKPHDSSSGNTNTEAN